MVTANTLAEEWRTIAGYEGFYEVSNRGRVRSVDRMTIHGRRRRGKVLSIYPGGSYRMATLAMNGINTTHRICRLVCIAFHGEPPSPLHEANHIHGDKQNDAASNLEWVTKSRNQQHACETGLRRLGERSYQAKLTNEQVIEIRRLYAAGGTTHAKLARNFSVSKSAIGNILINKNWKYIK